MTGLVLDIDRFSTHDGPGIRTTVFLKGCPLACRWCHSPESQSFQKELLYQPERCTACGLCVAECPEGALSLAENSTAAALDRGLCTNCGACAEACYPGALRMAGLHLDADTLASQISRDLPYFQKSGGGMTLSGGEPLGQTEFSATLLAACRDRGIHTALETTGHAGWDRLWRVASQADLILYDLKIVDDTGHQRLTGVSNQRILENLPRLVEMGSEIMVRVPCIPGLNDTPGQIGSLARVVADAGIAALTLLPYNASAGAKYQWLGREYRLGDLSTQSAETMAALEAVCGEAGVTAYIGNQG